MTAAASAGVDLVPQLNPQASHVAFWSTIIARAARRGELAVATVPPRVATLAVALLRHEFLLRGRPEVDDAAVVEIVDLIYLPLLARRSHSDPGCGCGCVTTSDA